MYGKSMVSPIYAMLNCCSVKLITVQCLTKCCFKDSLFPIHLIMVIILFLNYSLDKFSIIQLDSINISSQLFHIVFFSKVRTCDIKLWEFNGHEDYTGKHPLNLDLSLHEILNITLLCR